MARTPRYEDRRAAFIAAYLAQPLNKRNASAAALEAGYHDGPGLGTTAWRLLNDAEVSKAIDAAEAERRARYAASAERTIQELAYLAHSNIAHYGALTEDGGFALNFDDTSIEDFSAIKEIREVRKIRRVGDVEHEIVERTIKLADKHAALSTLATIQGLKREEGGVIVPVTFIITGRKERPDPPPQGALTWEQD